MSVDETAKGILEAGNVVTVRLDCPCATWTWTPEMIEQHPDWAENMLRHHNYCDGNGQNIHKLELI